MARLLLLSLLLLVPSTAAIPSSQGANAANLKVGEPSGASTAPLRKTSSRSREQSNLSKPQEYFSLMKGMTSDDVLPDGTLLLVIRTWDTTKASKCEHIEDIETELKRPFEFTSYIMTGMRSITPGIEKWDGDPDRVRCRIYHNLRCENTRADDAMPDPPKPGKKLSLIKTEPYYDVDGNIRPVDGIERPWPKKINLRPSSYRCGLVTEEIRLVEASAGKTSCIPVTNSEIRYMVGAHVGGTAGAACTFYYKPRCQKGSSRKKEFFATFGNAEPPENGKWLEVQSFGCRWQRAELAKNGKTKMSVLTDKQEKIKTPVGADEIMRVDRKMEEMNNPRKGILKLKDEEGTEGQEKAQAADQQRVKFSSGVRVREFGP